MPRPAPQKPPPRIDTFTRAYIEAALWSTNDNSDDQGGDSLLFPREPTSRQRRRR